MRGSKIMRGKLIVIEGTNCSGKETQAKLLETKLKVLKKSITCGIGLVVGP